MKENWNELLGKRILLRKKHLTTTSITEATVVEISKSGKYVKFKWVSGTESWETPEDEYSFSYDKILEVLDKKEEKGIEEEWRGRGAKWTVEYDPGSGLIVSTNPEVRESAKGLGKYRDDPRRAKKEEKVGDV
ncbi:hypothetical protein KAT21_05435 [Candidatus Bathyarchaeota archaeon]|nr:hypothetical protein [Candidatus Bathyarchaeota archaeon]